MKRHAILLWILIGLVGILVIGCGTPAAPAIPAATATPVAPATPLAAMTPAAMKVPWQILHSPERLCS